MEKRNLKGIIFNGIVTENPTFRLVLGMCPTLAITTSVTNGLGMGLAATFVLICSNVVISLMRRIIPAQIRIPSAGRTPCVCGLSRFAPAVNSALVVGFIFLRLVLVGWHFVHSQFVGGLTTSRTAWIIRTGR